MTCAVVESIARSLYCTTEDSDSIHYASASVCTAVSVRRHVAVCKHEQFYYHYQLWKWKLYNVICNGSSHHTTHGYSKPHPHARHSCSGLTVHGQLRVLDYFPGLYPTISIYQITTALVRQILLEMITANISTYTHGTYPFPTVSTRTPCPIGSKCATCSTRNDTTVSRD